MLEIDGECEGKQKMISFIVIGRNEAEHISLCIKSIYKLIHEANIDKYEILYIDSDSTDNTIELVKANDEIKIFKITNIYNVAIGRNIGAKKSSGDILFFIDGDMELIPTFFNNVFENGQLKYNYVSGNLLDVIDKSSSYRYKVSDKDEVSPGSGIFLIKRSLWNSIGGLKNKYRNLEDVDFTLRLSKKDILLIRKKDTIAKHYTISHLDMNVAYKTLFNRYWFFKGMLYREHLFTKLLYKPFMKNDRTLIILLSLTGASILFHNYWILLLYFVAVIGRILFQGITSTSDVVYRFPFIIIRDFQAIISFLFFYPKNTDEKIIKYDRIQ